MCKSITVYDHTTRIQVKGDLVQAFAEAKDSISSATFTLVETEIAETDVIARLLPFDVVVGHFNCQDNWDKLIKSSAAGTIRIRTSTAGRSGHTHINEEGVLVLQLQAKHNSVTRQEWKSIIEHLLTSDNAFKIVNGEIPPEMAKFFGSGMLVVMPALSILCQGYLIVCANQGNGKAVPDYLKRWASVPGSEMLKSVHVAEVQKRRFWNVFGEQGADKLVKLAESEWNGLAGDGKPTKVWQLLNAVVPDKHTPDERLVAPDEKLVADAFEAIEGKLGANRGK